MVEITNGVDAVIVTKGAVATYLNQGFHVVEKQSASQVKKLEGRASSKKAVEGSEKENKTVESAEAVNATAKKEAGSERVEMSDNEGAEKAEAGAEQAKAAEGFEELMEKPISQWSKEELKKFAKANGIDLSKAGKTSDVRAMVKQFIEAR